MKNETMTSQIRRQNGPSTLLGVNPAAAKEHNDRDTPGNSMTDGIERAARRAVQESNDDRGRGNQTPVAAEKRGDGNLTGRTNGRRAPNHIAA
ncbi:MAG: hypothetical protein NTZ10_03205 [Candidatus Saganbacteria bacterium]|nr:hypothetical protein [Candidatus Saganbacteria bacterium]